MSANLLFELLQVALGRRDGLSREPSMREWDAVEVLAEEQGVDGFLLSGIEPLTSQIPLEVKLQWIGGVMQMEALHEDYVRALASLAGFYNEHGLKMMVVKGYACGLDWPRPEHRPTGDIDIWLFGKQKIADEVLERETGIEVDRSHHHHTVFEWQGISVENHYDFINVHHHRSHVALERELKRLGADDSHFVEVHGERVYLPSANLHALFLLRHGMLHFCFGEFTMRNLLDWGFFVQKHRGEVDWEWLLGVLDEHGMRPLFDLFNSICVEDIGFVASLFPSAKVDEQLKARVLAEILKPQSSGGEALTLVPRLAFKWHRWRGNAWKHRLCYKESLWSAFWSGVWNHLLKPSSI